eukprot:scaffold45_cov368-Prasinococcus_capsulatus_cf.AAC.12
MARWGSGWVAQCRRLGTLRHQCPSFRRFACLLGAAVREALLSCLGLRLRPVCSMCPASLPPAPTGSLLDCLSTTATRSLIPATRYQNSAVRCENLLRQLQSVDDKAVRCHFRVAIPSTDMVCAAAWLP